MIVCVKLQQSPAALRDLAPARHTHTGVVAGPHMCELSALSITV